MARLPLNGDYILRKRKHNSTNCLEQIMKGTRSVDPRCAESVSCLGLNTVGGYFGEGLDRLYS